MIPLQNPVPTRRMALLSEMLAVAHMAAVTRFDTAGTSWMLGLEAYCGLSGVPWACERLVVVL